MANLVTERKSARRWAKRASDLLDHLLQATPVDDVALQEAINDLDLRIHAVDCVQLKIEQTIVDEKDLMTDFDEAACFRELCRAARSRAISHLKSVSESCASESKTHQHHDVKFPKLNLPKFSGDYTEWKTFWDKFNALVDQTDLPVISKYAYLDECLTGDAKLHVEGLAITEENYPIAREILERRFGRKERIIFAHIRGLLDLPRLSTRSTTKQLWTLHASILKHVRSLDALGVNSASAGMFLTPVILSLLPPDVRDEWSRHGDGREQDLPWLLKFMEQEIECKDRSDAYATFTPRAQQSSSSSSSKPSTTSALYSTTVNSCVFCGKSHPSERCFDMWKLSVSDRRARISSLNLCSRCLKSGHSFRECKSKARCVICNRAHNQIWCNLGASEGNRSSASTPAASTSVQQSSQSQPAGRVHVSNFVSGNSVGMLPIIRVKVSGPDDDTFAHVLLDSGSDRSYATSDLVHKIKPNYVCRENVQFASFGGNIKSDSKMHNMYELKLCSLKNDDSTSICAMEVPIISTPISRPMIPADIVSSLADLDLDESQFCDKPVTIDILIGMDYYWDVIKPGLRKFPGGPVAQETIFGWVLSGSVHAQSAGVSHQYLCISGHKSDLCSVTEKQVRDFWELEAVGISNAEKVNVDPVLTQFNESIEFKDGRYHVHLPWREDFQAGDLLNNRSIAQKRLDHLSRRFSKNPDLKCRYDSVFVEYEHLGIIEEVPVSEKEQSQSDQSIYYLPHRPVVREDHITTKVRPVFDASCKGFNDLSLNDCLETGPSLNPDLVETIIRFRRHQLALSADITKAFLQIGVCEKDQDVHRFLWDVNNQVRDMKFVRVIFGNKASPFLLNATIKYHLSLYPDSVAKTELLQNLYVDDWITGSDTNADCLDLFEHGSEILSQAGMTLSKCRSNIIFGKDSDYEKIFSHKDSGKILGINWLSDEDCFSFGGIGFSIPDLFICKRTVLSCISKLFDPLGFVNPFTIMGKILFQDIWQMGLDWDVPLTGELNKRFILWLENIVELQNLRLTRCYFPGTVWSETSENLELHVFCDASERAYGANVYIRTWHENSYKVSLVISKARISPLEKQTLPRLELLAALIGARLLKFVILALKLSMEKVSYYCWSDSQVTLGWIKGQPSKLKQFVRNRVTEIQDLTNPASWSYVNTKENPADLLTRGLNANELIESNFWYEGPAWLSTSHMHDGLSDDSVNVAHSENVESAEECIQTSTLTATSSDFKLPVERWGTFCKVLHIIAFILRFILNIKSEVGSRITGPLTLDELSKAKVKLFLYLQSIYYSSEVQSLQKEAQVPKSSSISKLDPFLDETGIMRIRGRLQHSTLSFSEKHPIILPLCHVTLLLVRFQHTLMKHAGVDTMLTGLRNSYWIVGARKLAKRVKRECVKCQRLDSVPCNRPVAPLPSTRVTESPPFSVCGVDYCGPVYCADLPGQKLYILLFTCAVIRAVHLEITLSLKVCDFILAFRRFVARRGIPSLIFSDNAKTFLKAKFKLIEVYGHVSPSWKFICPRSPWWGGFWERMVRCVKSSLKKSVGKGSLTKIELETALTEVEGCVNSRPLTFLGDTSDTESPITPSHFLIGRSSSFAPFSLLSDVTSVDPTLSSQDLSDRKFMRHNCLKKFWSIWSQTYLRNLPQVVPKFGHKNELKVGSVVLVGDDKVRRLDWPLAVVIELHEGSDGVVRSATLRTASGQITRPLQRMHLLEACFSEVDNIKSSENQADVVQPEIVQPDVVQPNSQPIQPSVQESVPVQTRTGRVIKPRNVLDL